MKTCALIRDGVVETILLIEDGEPYELEPGFILIEAPPGVGPGWRYVDDAFAPPPAEN